MYEPETLPDALTSVLEEVRAWFTAPTPGSAEERASWLAGLRQLVDATEARFTQVLAAFDATGDGETLHAACSTSSWLQGALHLSGCDAASRVHVARNARDELATPLASMAEGRMTYEHVRSIQRCLRPLPPNTHAEATVLLTDLAERVDPGRVRAAGRALREVIDPDGSLSEADTQFERRYLHLSPLLDGMTSIEGLLDAEAATTLSTALAPFLVPTGADDDRSAAQRRADGLVDVANTAMRSGELPELSGAPAQLQVLIPWEKIAPLEPKDVTASTDAMEITPPNPLTGAGLPRLPEHPGGTAILPRVSSERLACDGSVARVLLDPDSLPLELGRSRRLFSNVQRRALALRDADGCRFPDCNRPARYTDAHHVVAWADGGASDLDNALLVCRFHHRKVHEGGWTVSVEEASTGTNGRVWMISPDGRRIPSDPRGP